MTVKMLWKNLNFIISQINKEMTGERIITIKHK